MWWTKRDLKPTATPVGKAKPVLLRALEPRIMFDAAVVATAAHADTSHAEAKPAPRSAEVADRPTAYLTNADQAGRQDTRPAPAGNDAAPNRPATNAADPAAQRDTQVAPAATLPASLSNAEPGRQIVFVDGGLSNVQTLLNGISPNLEVIVIRPDQDGLQVIADTVAGRSDIDAIHIISHGEVGRIELGNSWIDSADVASHTGLLGSIGQSLSQNGDILLYGCKVGADGKGADFINALAKATGADVAASTDNTGSTHLGGNWVLEARSGSIEAGLFGTAAALDHYDALLAAPTSENFDGVAVNGGTGQSQGTTGAPRVINGWTFTLLNSAGTQDAGGYVDVTQLSTDTSMANGGTDHAAVLNGTYVAASSGTQAAGVFKATTGEEFSFVSITVENGGGANTYRLVGYRDGSAVSGATQNFTAPAFGSNTVVSVSGSQWQYVDEVRIVQQNGAADISIYIDDIVVAAAVPPNVAPVATTSGGTTAFTEGNNVASTPVVIDSGITITDSDNSTLASGTVSITGNFQTGQDVLAFTNNPATMGNISGSYNSGTGILSLTSSGATATLAQWQAALRSVTYTDSSDTPNTGNRTISFVVNDSIANSTAGTKTVSVGATNDTPIATASGGTTAFTEGNNVTSTPVAIDSGFTVSDLDSSTLSTATVSITGNLHNTEDVLAFTNTPATMGNISGSYNSTTGVMSLSSAGATATLAQWQAALRSVTYTDSADTPNTGNRTISFVVNDGSTSSSTVTKTVSVAAVNDTPVDTTSGGTTAFTEGNNTTSTPVAVDSGFTVTDADNSTLASATVAITGNLQTAEDVLAFTNNPATMGNISGSYNSGTGILSLSSAGATATTAQWQAALRSITYSNSSETPNTSNRTISFTTNDGTADGNTATKIVSVAAVNDTPIATASGGTTAFTEGANVTSTPVVVDSGITLSDIDSTTFASATVAITANLQTAEDVLAFTNNPATMGNISGSYNSGTGILSLSSAGATATKAQWQAALQSVTYTNSSDNPNTSNRTVSFVVNDGSTNSTATTKTVSVAAANDVPVDTASGGNTAFVQGNNTTSTPVAVDSGFTVTDGDNSTLASATVAITGNFQNGEDELAFTNNPATMGNISASYNAATGVLTLTSAGATATTAQWQAALRSVTYTDTASTVNTSNRTISFTTNDGTADGNTVTKTITVTATSQSPIAASSGGTTAFTEGANVTSTPVVVDSGITLSDSDSTTLASATVSITANLHTAEDTLAFTNNPATMGNISASYNAATGVLTLTSAGATATKAQWQAALQSVTYTNSSDNPNTSNRTISFVVNDGNSNSNAATKTVSIAATNDVPVDTTSGGTTAFNQGNPTSTPVVIDSGFTVTDGDNSTLASATVAITGNFQNGEDELAFTNNPATMGNISASYNAATGVLTLTSAGATATTAQWQNALRSVTYTDTAGLVNTSTRTISFTTNDGTADGNTATKSLSVTAYNFPPVTTTSGGSAAFTEGANVTSTPVVIDSGITVSDIDTASLASATVSITGNFQTGEDVLAFTNNPATMGNIAGSYNAATGVLTLTSAGATATTAQWQAALRTVSYTNSSDTPNTGNRTISFAVNDGNSTGNAATRDVTVAAANDVPVDTTSGGTTAFNQGNPTSTPVVIDSGFTVTDGDNSTLASATVAITGNFQNGEDELAFTNNPATMGNIGASYNAATGVLTLTSAGATATTAQWQAALRSVTYTDTAGTVNTSTRTISFTTNDGTGNGNTATKAVSVAAYNFPPVTTTSGGNTTFTEGAVTSTPVVIDSGITVSDIDTANLASATVSITGNFQTGEDVLAFTNNPATMGNIAASYNAATGVLTLTSAGATATKAQWQAALRTVTYTDTSHNPDTGNRTISFAVNDGNSTGNIATKLVAITAFNNDPVNTVPVSQAVAENGTLTFNTGNSNLISISDVDSNGGVERVTLTATNGLLTLSGTTGLSFLVGNGTNDGTATFEGTLADINNALNGLTFTPTPGYHGSASVQITLSDLGLTGSGGTKTDTDTVNINVFGINPAVLNVDATSANGTYVAGQTVTLQVKFDQIVNVDTTGGTPTLLLETGSVDRNATYVSGSGTDTLMFSYTVQTGDTSSDLDVNSTSALALNGATIQSAGSNNAVLTLPTVGGPDSIGGQHNIIVDGVIHNVSPTVGTVGVPAPGTYIGGQTLEFTVNYSEAVFVDTSGGIPRLMIDIGGNSIGVDYAGGSGSSTLTFRITLGSGGSIDTDGITITTTLDSNGGRIRSGANIDASLNLNGIGRTDAVLIDTIAPYPGHIAPIDPSPLVGDVARYIATFSEGVQGVDAGDFALVTTGSAHGQITSITQVDARTYIVTVSNVGGTGSLQLDLNGTGTGIRDLAGNAIVAGLAGGAYEISNGNPTINSITSSNGAFNEGDGVNFTVTLSSATSIDTSGGTPRLALDVGGQTVYADYVAGSGSTTLTFHYVVAAGQNDTDGIAVASFDSNGALLRDSQGRTVSLALPAPVALGSVIIDTTPPTATGIIAVDANPTSATSVAYTVTFSENVFGVDGADFTLSTTGSAAGTIASVTQLTASTYSIQVSNVSGDGTLSVSLRPSGTGIADRAGNNINGGLSGGLYTIGNGNPPPVPTPAPDSIPAPSPSQSAPAPAPTPAPLITLVALDPTSFANTPTLNPTSNTISFADAPTLNPTGTMQTFGAGTLSNNTFGVDLSGGNSTITPLNDGRMSFVELGSSSSAGLQAMPEIGNFSVVAGEPISIALPASTFSHSDRNVSVTVEVRLVDGRPLPVWLKFDPVTGTLVGKPPAGMNQKLQIEIIARDNKGNRASSHLDLTVKAGANRAALDITDTQLADAGLLQHPLAGLMHAADNAAGKPALAVQFDQFGRPARHAAGNALLHHLAMSRQPAQADAEAEA
ncbi:hypothetical protein IGB42_03410 [Andreprevotia sp. IGB-42]|uniref:DUF4347 domain-containing protein n=1 Tax=Andreprevotia sp. IGB-42 TaxID=2497473 RepID=UPI0013587363|nr:DUF4347 domain-containing protein [Andreprevotia sp. IGB-42]KAF0812133.1 hypothetical protein IGB42_03410 [Andreprevotia sp. IGB-42]